MYTILNWTTFIMIDVLISEEVFSSNKALWTSPDGNKLLYAKLDDREVETMALPIYGEPGSLTSQYTKLAEVRYPKVRIPEILFLIRFYCFLK